MCLAQDPQLHALQSDAFVLFYVARALGIPRSDLFFTSKVNARSHSIKETPKAIRQSLNRSQLEYIDLYLLHDAISGRQRRVQAYRCLLDAMQRGQIRHAGVSNWNVHHLKELEEEGLPSPSVNQIELHPWCQQVCIRRHLSFTELFQIADRQGIPFAIPTTDEHRQLLPRAQYHGTSILSSCARRTNARRHNSRNIERSSAYSSSNIAALVSAAWLHSRGKER